MNTLSPKRRVQANGKWAKKPKVAVCEDRASKATARRIIAEEAIALYRSRAQQPITYLGFAGERADTESSILALGPIISKCIGVEREHDTAEVLRTTYSRMSVANPGTQFGVAEAYDYDIFTRNTSQDIQDLVFDQNGVHLTWLDWFGPWDKQKAHTVMALINRSKSYFKPVFKHGCNPLLYLTLNVGMERKDDMRRLLSVIPSEIRTTKILPQGDKSNTYVHRGFGLLHQINQWLYWEDLHAEMRNCLIYCEPKTEKTNRGQLMLLIGFEIMRGTAEPESLNHDKEFLYCGRKSPMRDSGSVKFKQIPLVTS